MPKPWADTSAGKPRHNTNADHAFRRIRKAPQANGGDGGTGRPTLPLARTLVKPDASSGVRIVPLDVRRQSASRASAPYSRRRTRARWAAAARVVARRRGRYLILPV